MAAACAVAPFAWRRHRKTNHKNHMATTYKDHLCECGQPATYRFPVQTMLSGGGYETGDILVCDHCLNLEVESAGRQPDGLTPIVAAARSPWSRSKTQAIIDYLRSQQSPATVREIATALNAPNHLVRRTLTETPGQFVVAGIRPRPLGVSGAPVYLWRLKP